MMRMRHYDEEEVLQPTPDTQPVWCGGDVLRPASTTTNDAFEAVFNTPGTPSATRTPQTSINPTQPTQETAPNDANAMPATVDHLIPEVNLRIETAPVVARGPAPRVRWAPEEAQRLVTEVDPSTENELREALRNRVEYEELLRELRPIVNDEEML